MKYYFSQSFNIANVARVSPSCVKNATSIETSSGVLSLAISQASKDIKFIKVFHLSLFRELLCYILY